MSIQDQLTSQITGELYAACWTVAEHPSFAEFLRFAIPALVAALPAEATNLQVTIASSALNRIHTGGSFQLGEDDYRIYGEIVWVPKHKFFRGKPGYQKIEPHPVPPPDPSDCYALVDCTTRDLNGWGASLLVSPGSLMRAFGQPGEADGWKKSGMYLFEGNQGSAFRINDNSRETTLYWGDDRADEFPTPGEFWNSDEICDLQVMGNADPTNFIAWVKSRIAQATRKMHHD